MGFDGVHVNIEPVESGSTRFLDWLDYLKTRIGKDKILSIAASKPAYMDSVNISPLRSWDTDYFQAVARHADQLVIMNYDTGFRYPSWYSFYTRERVKTILGSLSQAGLGCKVLLGVATYDPAPAHIPAAENIASAVQGLRSALACPEVPRKNFEGIAVYGYWTTSDSEWKEFTQSWVKR